MTQIVVLQDSREKEGKWNFLFSSLVKDQKIIGLKEGDYTIEGLEEVLRIERKRTTSELAINLGSKFKQFKAEFEKLKRFKYKYLVCEFSLDTLLEFPVNSSVPKYLWSKLRLNGKFMLKKIEELSAEYGVEFLFCNNKYEAEQTVLEIFRSVYMLERENDKT
jgi:hypothetical protein